MRPWTLWGQPGSTIVYYKLYSESKQLEGANISMWSGAFKQEHRYIFAPYEECSLTRCHLETKDIPHTHRNKIYGAAFAFLQLFLSVCGYPVDTRELTWLAYFHAQGEKLRNKLVPPNYFSLLKKTFSLDSLRSCLSVLFRQRRCFICEAVICSAWTQWL